MIKLIKKFLFVFTAVLSIAVLSACGGEVEITDQAKLLEIKNEVTFAETNIIDNITLPVFDDEVTASWSSNRQELLSNDGTVVRPSFDDGDTKVFLTLTLEIGESSVTRIFEFIVLAEAQAIEITTLDEIVASISFPSTDLSESLTLPIIDTAGVTAVWTSTSAALGTDGTVTRPSYTDDDIDVLFKLVLTFGEYDITVNYNFTVLAEEKPSFIELNTDFTDALVLGFDYSDKNFIADGYGEVDLVRCVDGDTAVFTEDGVSFTIRFLGIDTPESTYKFDPWGKEASGFTCDKLTNATSIVLEYDVYGTERTDGNGRYLGWVWYDGRLLNLELVEEAYSGSKGVGGTAYENTFYLAEFKTQDTDRRIWGEDDPNFDYSLDGIQITIEELVTNQAEYVGKKVVISGIVARQVGGHPYIISNGFGIYLYKGYEFTTKLAEGNEVLISGLTLTYYPDVDTGAPQLTGFSKTNIEVLSEGNVVEPVTTAIPDLELGMLGSLIKVMNLTVTDIYENTYDDAFTVTAVDGDGNEITIRRDGTASSDITIDLFTVGTTFDIIGPLGRYQSEYQLMISKLEDIIFD